MSSSHSKRWLIAVPSPRETRAVLDGFENSGSLDPWEIVQVDESFDVVRTGVGKSNAAGAVACVANPDQHEGVLSVGIGGVLPNGHAGSRPQILDTVIATRSVFSDEGVGTPDGFIPCDEMGFGYFKDGSMGVDHDPRDIERFGGGAQHRGIVACVSWCSGADGCADGVVKRTGAIVEAMEGASSCLSADRLGLRTSELRVISNTTGDRDRQVWDLDGALRTLRARVEDIRTFR